MERLTYRDENGWVVYDEDRIEHIKLITKMFGVSVEEYNKINKCEPMLYSNFCGLFKNICPIQDCFETKEDAEEYAEFGNITRTEKLPYVSWEKFKNKEGNYSFKVYPYDYYCYTDGRYVRIKQYYGSLDRIVFTKPLTRENYNEARRLCIKLFKGENNG